MPEGQTIYEFAYEQMSQLASDLLELAQSTHNFINPSNEIWTDPAKTELLLCGKGFTIDEILQIASPENAWLGRQAIPFSIERAATAILYSRIPSFTNELITSVYEETNNLTEITPEWIRANPRFLPVLMHVTGVFSKQDLKTQLKSANDRRISRPAAMKLAKLIPIESIPNQSSVRDRIRQTVEGIVRDLVGKLLLERFVASALQRHEIPFKRENEYDTLEGVVYNIRADFVIPDPKNPRAFIEVRKSSSRHASLYLKDKIFSAINWKGKHEKCLGILVIDGSWNVATLRVLAGVFDYVVPIGQVDRVAAKVRSYLDGDESVLQWLIQFRILRNSPTGKPTLVKKLPLQPNEIETLEEVEEEVD